MVQVTSARCARFRTVRARARRGKGGRVTVIALVMAFAILQVVPSVAADGMPVMTTVTIGDEPADEVFGSIFENRQLAEVELVNDTHERINLFLSVYSLDPGKNLSIAVPLRTMPAYVHGTPMKESRFRQDYNLDRAELEVDRQDMGTAWGRVGESMTGALELAFGSLACSLPGEIIRERAHVNIEGSPDFLLLGGMTAGSEEGIDPDLVAHYEFDGFSVDILRVGAGPTLADYLAVGGRVTPADMPVDAYGDDYVAVIESVTKPPIEQERFDVLRREAPAALEYIRNYTHDNPILDGPGIVELKDRVWSRQLSHNHGSTTDIAFQLIDAIYAEMDFSGEVLTMQLPLDSGKIFFPLGTSVGWPNKVGDIAVLFRVPEDRALGISGTEDVFFSGSHWYLFETEHANPGFDLESTITGAGTEQRDLKMRAAFLTDNAKLLATITVAILTVAIWLVAAVAADRGTGRKGKVLRSPVTWLMLGTALVLSVPGALLVYLMVRPVPLEELRLNRVAVACAAAFPVAVAVFAIGVAL